jgi:hypothetical protein
MMSAGKCGEAAETCLSLLQQARRAFELGSQRSSRPPSGHAATVIQSDLGTA